ncbi:hypothetical protein ETAA1_16740 [Urbifossiella limnaea]|uniref:Uncharacterized protein n=1 Tax=Urbifossiella limnaea TaxID=2528023 RepID=A0A517XQF7_9BACT|nr:hypothetical protein ETAA1_16740 [Urbifossiella limnaea]
MRWSGGVSEGKPATELYLAAPPGIAASGSGPPVPVWALLDTDAPTTRVRAALLIQAGGEPLGGSPPLYRVRICFVDWFYARRYGGPGVHFLDRVVAADQDLAGPEMTLGRDILSEGSLTVDSQTRGFRLELLTDNEAAGGG